MATILVVDDDPRIIGALATVLPDDGHTVVGAASGERALELARSQRPDIIMLDIVMPGMDGLEVLSELRADARLAAIPVIILTGRDSREERAGGLDRGADDYIGKPFDMTELRARVRAVLRRARGTMGDDAASGTQPTQLACGPIEMDVPRRRVTVNGEPVALTPTEFELLRHFMQRPARVLTSQELLRDVWEYPEGTGDSGLVRWHIRNLRLKVELNSDEPIYVQTVSGHGYMRAPDEPGSDAGVERSSSRCVFFAPPRRIQARFPNAFPTPSHCNTSSAIATLCL